MTVMIAGIDGYQTVGVPADGGCCPPSLCNINATDFICSFMAYMPSGPLWDFWKRFRSDQMRASGDICNLTGCVEAPACLTIIDHAIYTAKKLLSILQNPLQTAIWESNPLTAFITRQNWLTTFGWEDCFEGPSINAKLGFPTPYQAVCNKLASAALCAFDTTLYQMSPSIENPNPIIDIELLVKAACPPALTLAVQYATLLSLKRLQLGIIKNQEGINFILAPLGAQISMVITDPLIGCIQDCGPQMSGTPDNCVMVDDCSQMTGTQACQPYRPCVNVVLSNIGETLNGGPGITEPLTCSTAKNAPAQIPASYTFPGVTMPVTRDCPPDTIAGNGTIWPGMMAAECILLSILPAYLNYTLVVATS
jgi:hypothetical protein